MRAARLHFGERAARDGDIGWRRPARIAKGRAANTERPRAKTARRERRAAVQCALNEENAIARRA